MPTPRRALYKQCIVEQFRSDICMKELLTAVTMESVMENLQSIKCNIEGFCDKV